MTVTRDSALDDPEVRADLALRDRSARDRPGRRGIVGLDVGQDPDGLSPDLARLYDSPPDPIVESWPCRGGCGQNVGVTQVGLDRLAEANAMLARRGEKPIGRHEVMWCPNCRPGTAERGR